MEELGPIHVLVNNAGYGITKPLEELTVDEWDAVLNTNLRGAFLMVKYTLPLLKQGKGVLSTSPLPVLSCLSLIQKPILPQKGHCSLNPCLSRILRAVWHPGELHQPGWIETNPEAVLTLEITASTWWGALVSRGYCPSLRVPSFSRGWVYYRH